MGGLLAVLCCAVAPGEVRAAEEGVPEEALIDEAALEAAFDFESLEDLDISDEFALLVQEDIVVSASRRAQRIDDSPSAITVITREDLRLMPFDNVADVLRTVPGMDVWLLTIAFPSSGSRSGSSNEGSNILVLVDGRDVLLPIFQLPLWLAMPVDLASIERIEVIRGPASTLYGANALQGVVNIVTRRAEKGLLTVEAELSGYRPETLSGNLKASGTRGRFSWWSSWGYDRRSPFHEPGRVGAWFFRSRNWLRYEGDEVEATLEVGGGAERGDIVTFAGNGDGYYEHLYVRADAIVHDWRLRFFFDLLDTELTLDLNLRMPNDPSMVMAQLPQPVFHPTRAYVADAERIWKLSDDLRLLTGLSTRLVHHGEGSFVTCPESAPTAFDPAACEPSVLFEGRVEGFTQLEWRVASSLELNAGVRAGYNTLVPEPGFSPRLTAVYRPMEHHTVRASVARAYRQPSFFEQKGHLLLEPGTLQDQDLFRRIQHIFATGLGGEELVNTKVDIAELGWRGRFLQEKLRVEVELYLSRYRDEIELDASSLWDVQYFAGLPIIGDEVKLVFESFPSKSWSAGAEIAASWRLPIEGLELDLAYGLDQVYERVELPGGEVEQRRNKREPTHHLILGARYGGEGLRLSAFAFWTSGFWGGHVSPDSILSPNRNTPLAANTLVFARAGWAFGLGGTEWEAGLQGHTPILGLEMRETSGEYLEDGSNYYGHPILPRLQGYLRSRF
ncbi:MAG: TonB-dependent receptor [Deltaproteobacteria bacterium]|nr:TonB-dependent receptor [Deltaproteobacteria bacterium]